MYQKYSSFSTDRSYYYSDCSEWFIRTPGSKTISFVVFDHQSDRGPVTNRLAGSRDPDRHLFDAGYGTWRMFDLLRRFADGDHTGPRVGLFVDGPNVLRDEFDTDLDELRSLATERGDCARTVLYLDEHATPGLIQAAEARGFEVVLTSGDVDVKLAIDATAAVADDRLDVLVLVSRDTDFKPVVELARAREVTTVAVAPGEYGTSDALANAANESIVLDGDV